MDEVGRGPLAGPVLTCAVIFPRDVHILSVNDSKNYQKRNVQAFTGHLLIVL